MKKIKAFFSNLAARPIIFCFIASPLMNLFIESLHRRSLLAGLSHVVFNPIIFLYNSLIIFMTLSVAMLFKRKYFFFTVILVLWTLLGITNGVLRSYRDNPLSAVDFFIVKASGDFIKDFFGWWQITLAVLVVAVIVGLCVLLWKKGPRPNVKKLTSLIVVVVSMISVATATVVGLETEILSNDFVNLPEAYENYGFAYCFSCSVLDTGIEKPVEYSENAVKQILEGIPSDKAYEKEKPDIVIVQLESFFDLSYIRGLEISEDTMPNFRALKEKYPSGLISVQSIGGGTANTEFEVLTGMDLEHFGPGEYPFMTVLCDETIPAMPHYLDLLGYTSHAFHNYTGVFYDRHKVYANLGFDTFTPMEYMNDLSRNSRGWVKDSCLVPYITDAIERDENSFVWAVSVQCHGDYPNERLECKYDVKISGLPEEKVIPTEYFANQVREVDDFIGELISELEKREEPTIVLLYGDHLPPLGIDEDMLEGISLYQTEYVIWSNFVIENEDRDMEAHQLGARLFELIGYRGSLINALSGSESELQMIEYDILYGERYSMGGKSIPTTDMKMGIDDIVIRDIRYEGDKLTVIGENFTENSVVCVDPFHKDTVYIDSNTLEVEDVRVREGDEISVVQVANAGIVLGESNIVKKEES